MPPVPGTREAYLPGVLLELGQEALVVARRKARVHRITFGVAATLMMGVKIGQRVVGDLRVDRRVRGGGRHGGHASE